MGHRVLGFILGTIGFFMTITGLISRRITPIIVGVLFVITASYLFHTAHH
jgi:hypothetical protein